MGPPGVRPITSLAGCMPYIQRSVRFPEPLAMPSGRMTHATVRMLDWIAQHTLKPSRIPAHLETGRHGEEDAYFFLRQHGYVLVARNYRSPRRRGEIDLIGWDQDVLCFIEVKTRTSHDVKPAEAAVDRDKQRELVAMAQEYLRSLPTFGQWRFDIVSVYYEGQSGLPQIELFKNAFPVS
jgi:putative endonuclease